MRCCRPSYAPWHMLHFFFFQAEDGIRDLTVTGVQTCALPISGRAHVYRGGPGGISNDRQVTLMSPDASGLQFGASVAGAGDVDGDGYPDFVVAEIGRGSCRERG